MKTRSDCQHATFSLVESLWWRDHIVPLTVVTCPGPGNIDRGYVSSNDHRDYDYGETVKYGCNGDYVLEGSLEIVCQQNGKWSEKPSCKGRTTTYITVTLHDTFLVITAVLGVILEKQRKVWRVSQFGFMCRCFPSVPDFDSVMIINQIPLFLHWILWLLTLRVVQIQ